MTSGTTRILNYQRRLRQECQMYIKQGIPVQVSMPSGMPERYPRFATSFNGRRGRVVRIATLRGIEIPHAIIVDITRPKSKKTEWLYVERSWLSHVRNNESS